MRYDYASGVERGRRKRPRERKRLLATDEMRGLIAELRANPWYMRLYFAQVAAWLAAVVVYETAYAPDAPLLKRAIDGGVTMSFLAYGSLVTSVIVVDVTQAAYQKGKELMGILLGPVKNKFEAIGEERGEARGRREGLARGEALGEARGRREGEALGEARGFRDGLARGEERGKARGAAIMAARSAAWFADMKRAQKEGREFNEPPPWEQDDQSEDD